MKTISFTIPTTWDDFKYKMWCLIHPIRMRHNRSILYQITREICAELKSDYWKNDISEIMRERLTDGQYSVIRRIVLKHLNELR